MREFMRCGFTRAVARVVVVFGLFGVALPVSANSLVFSQTVQNTDFAMFGVGGLRGNSAATLTVTGVSGTVTRALLLWHGPTATGSSANGSLTFAGVARVGTVIGVSEDNLWAPFTESRAYVADVTSSVPGDGAYALTALVNDASAAMNGATLLVFFNDGNAGNNRDVVLFNGNDSNIANGFDPAGWFAQLNGINYTGGAASLRVVVSDGQNPPVLGDDSGIALNGTTLLAPGPNFQGGTLPTTPGSSVTNGGLWDHVSFDVAPFLIVGTNNLTLTDIPPSSDALSLVAVVFDLPVGAAPPPPGAPSQNVVVPTMSEWAMIVMALLVVLTGAISLRGRGSR